MEGIYKQAVTVEKIEFNEGIKKKLKAGEKGVSSDVRLNDDGVFTGFRSVNNQQTAVEEGQTIITFVDGSQKLLTEDEVKENLSITKKKSKANEDTSQSFSQSPDDSQPDAEISPESQKIEDPKPGKSR